MTISTTAARPRGSDLPCASLPPCRPQLYHHPDAPQHKISRSREGKSKTKDTRSGATHGKLVNRLTELCILRLPARPCRHDVAGLTSSISRGRVALQRQRRQDLVRDAEDEEMLLPRPGTENPSISWHAQRRPSPSASPASRRMKGEPPREGTKGRGRGRYDGKGECVT